MRALGNFGEARLVAYPCGVAWDDDEEWPELSDDPEAVERRRQASREIANARQKALRWAYAGLGFLIALVLYLAAR